MVYTDPYTPARGRYECRECGTRTTSEDRPAGCPECGGPITNLAVPRE